MGYLPMRIRRADRRPAPEVQHDDHVDAWLARGPAKPKSIKVHRAPAQHDAHFAAWRLELLIERQIAKFTVENVRKARADAKRRGRIRFGDDIAPVIFDLLCADLFPHVRYRGWGTTYVAKRLISAFSEFIGNEFRGGDLRSSGRQIRTGNKGSPSVQSDILEPWSPTSKEIAA